MSSDEELETSAQAIGADNEYLCSEIMQKCQTLLEGIDQLQEFISNNKRYRPIQSRLFENRIKSEIKFIKKISELDVTPEKLSQLKRSTNLIAYQSVWEAVRRCNGVTALHRCFYWDGVQRKNLMKTDNANFKDRDFCAWVDIVAQDGLEWVKVCTITEKRLIFDMAKAGLVWGDSSDDSEDEGLETLDGDDSSLLRLVKDLLKASRANRIRYKLPKIRIVLPRLRTGRHKDIDKLLNQIRALGVTLQTAESIPPAPALVDCMSRIPVDTLDGFTDVLNLDCTILITLISDMCHAQIPGAEWHNKNVSRQIVLEKDELLLPTVIWPLFSSRRLVCTAECARKLEEIVNTIGSPSEKLRHRLVMDKLSSTSQSTREQRIEEFQKHSTYAVPKELHLPVSVVDVDILGSLDKLPKSAEIVSGTLSSLNRSTFFYGWLSSNTTITTNGVATKEIERIVEANRTNNEETGPDVVVLPSPRSLSGTQRMHR